MLFQNVPAVVTTLFLAIPWLFPIAALLARVRGFGKDDLRWQWARLDESQASVNAQTDSLLSTHPIGVTTALRTGIVVAAIYALVLIAVRVWIRAVVPEGVRDTDAFKIALFYTSLYSGAMLQLLVAIVVAARLRYLRVEHALFGAFVAAKLMLAGNSLTVLLFGGRLDPTLVGSFYALMVNPGAVCALIGSVVTVACVRKESVATQPNLQVTPSAPNTL